MGPPEVALGREGSGMTIREELRSHV